MTEKNKKVDWQIIIPIIIWCSCIGLSVGKMFQTGNEIHIIDWLDIFNSNTFSTYISIVMCMIYQFFAFGDKKQQEKWGLSRKWIALTIIATAIYTAVAIINACRYCYVTVIIMMIVSVAYVITFFKFMILKK